MIRPRILVIDDDATHREGMILLLESKGYEVKGAANGKEALDLLDEQTFDLLITDYKMEQIDGMSLLRILKEDFPSIKVIMVTGYGSIEGAVEAMKSGAINYITKPVQPAKLLEIVQQLVADSESFIKRERVEKILSQLRHFHQMVGLSKPMQEVYKKIREVAETDLPVLITGESGTGKELVAKAIHDMSMRASGKFVAVNTGAIPRELIASELFGHTKGAFTHAFTDKKGKFEEANQGTLFLDEIGTMDMQVQISLLRVLETKVIERVGSNKSIPIDVRIICASNEDLTKLIEEKKFREDLYYRLNVFSIELPPLRERKQDIPHLIKYFVALFNYELNRKVRGITKEALQVLKKYSWPGNVRELRNILLRAILSAKEVIDISDLPPEVVKGEVKMPAISFKPGTPLSEVEKTMILKTLEAVKGNKLKAAEILGISRRSLYNKLEEYDISG